MVPSTETAHMVALRTRFPASPETELLRFCRARPKSAEEAAKMYEAYLEWRKGQGMPKSLALGSAGVPAEWLRCCGTARDGTPAAYCQGARFDPAVDPEQYALMCCHLIDQATGPDDMTRVTILVDVRAGNGWHNAPPQKMLGFFRLANALLNSYYPERAQRVILYPVPMLLKHLWTMFGAMLDSVTKEKFIILTGSASAGAPCPKELADYIAADQFPPDAQPLHQYPQAKCKDASRSKPSAWRAGQDTQA